MDFRGLLAGTNAAQGILSSSPAPNYGGTTPPRSVPLWFGGKPAISQGTAPWVSPQQNSYWPQILALLQNPLALPTAPGVQPVPGTPGGLPLPIPPQPQLPPIFPGGGGSNTIPPGAIPPATPGTGGAGTVLPPTNTQPPPGGTVTPPPPTPTPIPTPAPTGTGKWDAVDANGNPQYLLQSIGGNAYIHVLNPKYNAGAPASTGGGLLGIPPTPTPIPKPPVPVPASAPRPKAAAQVVKESGNRR